jgi:DHA2 family multidrug resistance protein
LDGSRLEVQQRVLILQKSFMSKGYSSNEALNKAYQIMDFSVMKQATVQSYMDIFLFLGLLFICCIPIIFLVKKGQNKISLADAAH